MAGDIIKPSFPRRPSYPVRWTVDFSSRVFQRIQSKVSDLYRPFISPDHPLQAKLLIEMPGVYKHSLAVGSAAAIAAHKISADPDIARVIGYYHDIGKSYNPEFFAGAVSGLRVRPAKITGVEGLRTLLDHPRQSARILVEFGGFPDLIIKGVEQHHGQMRTYAILDDALRGEPEDSFYYPGPKPQFKEAALVMIADGVEAFLARLSQSNEMPSMPSRPYLRSVVNKVIQDLKKGRQFDFCGLTETDIYNAEGEIMWFFFRFYNNLDLEKTPEIFEKHGR